ncbi:hypothetical protein ACFW7K_01455 [Streptomyces sp. NPDC058735]|uniref:hypothetical protein n=1 Tax=Streptomyces sp. NPDC058735 TaxID=3346616 RepID=UPI003678156B
MTQSGQGEEPSARPAREGIVLPSDGGEPLLPGAAGGPGEAHRPAQPAAPAEGRTWGQPWGPDQQTPPQPGQTWQPPQQQQQWGTPEQPAWDDRHQAPGALPPEGAQPPNAYSAQPPAGGDPYGSYGTQGGASPLPPEGAGHGGPQQQVTHGYGSPAGGGLPQAADAYGSPAGPGSLPQAPDAYGNPAAGGPAPSHGGPYGAAGAGGPQQPADEAATRYIPPVAPDANAAPTQYLPPVAPGADEGATQYIPPVRPGTMPPESSSGEDPEATRFLGTGPLAGAGAGPLQPASHPDAEATQYMAPVPGGDQQPPDDFGHLFRSDQGAAGPAGATQQLPRIEEPQPAYAAAQPSRTPPGGGRSRGGRTGSRAPVIAAVGIGIAVLGVGAGALLAGGGGDDGEGDDNKTVAASAPATEDSASPSADPARAQAVELDKLLADSGDSRSTVINAVADVKGCDNLAQAAKDLREAAKQRNQLVTRLRGIEVDKLPDHAALTTALTKAWQASASADDHYAAWADQTAGKKGCKKGQARVTGQTQAGNRASGVASSEKAKAAALWNGIAKSYGLTERQPTQL